MICLYVFNLCRRLLSAQRFLPTGTEAAAPFLGAAIPSVRRYIHNAYATPYERSNY